MEISEAKWAEVERRMMALEERTTELVARFNTHEAVCLERQKTMLNTMAAIQTGQDVLANRMESNVTLISTRMDASTTQLAARMEAMKEAFSTRLNAWITAVAGGAIVCTGALTVLILTHGLGGK